MTEKRRIINPVPPVLRNLMANVRVSIVRVCEYGFGIYLVCDASHPFSLLETIACVYMRREEVVPADPFGAMSHGHKTREFIVRSPALSVSRFD